MRRSPRKICALFHPDGFGHGDLHVVDVSRFHIGSKMPLAKRKHHDVLDRLLTQEVVHPIDLRSRQHLKDRALSSRAEARSLPNGFSMMTRRKRPSFSCVSPAAPSAPRWCRTIGGRPQGKKNCVATGVNWAAILSCTSYSPRNYLGSVRSPAKW